jgi:hypothetical protein
LKTAIGCTDAPRRAVLVQRQRVGIGDVSRTGCRVGGAQRLAIGAIGMLAVDIHGRRHVELFRVSRSTALPGSDRLYEAGVEFLPMPGPLDSLHDVAAQLDQSDAS